MNMQTNSPDGPGSAPADNEKLEFGVDIDDADPRVVRVWDCEQSYPCRFSTEADAKMADALATKMMEIVCALWRGGAQLLEEKTWPSGARPSGEPPCPHTETEAANE